MTNPFSMKTESVIDALNTDVKAGLTNSEAEKRLAQYGPNSLGEEKKVPLWKRFLQQFADAMVLILIGAAVLSAIMAVKEGGFSGWIDVIVILAIVIINAILGVYQEGKADEAIAALKKMSSPQAKVVRDNIQQLVDSDKLVPGDIVVLDAGDLVAADIRLTEASSMKVEEASLTGESVPVDKDATAVLEDDCGIGDRKNMLYMGTAVTYGRGRGIVVETGATTELGKIANRLSSIDNEETPLQKNLNKLGKILGIVCIAICLIVFVVDVFVQKEAWDEALMTAVSLAVAAIPEGLAAVVTIVLALGMTKMASKNAIVRRLLAVETLGCVDVICTDKTGTLTQNEMTVRKVFDGEKSFDVTGIGYAPEGQVQTEDGTAAPIEGKLKRLLQSCVLCSDAVTPKGDDGRYTCIGDPTEAALIALGAKSGMPKDETNKSFPRVAELPFDSDRKMMTTYHPNIVDGAIVSFTKGAPDIVLGRCIEYFDGEKNVPMTDELRKKIEETNHGYATTALRVLAFAYRTFEGKTSIESDFEHEKDLCFLGLVGMIDPARTEVKDAMAICRDAGIRAVMITGDYKDTAVAIANDLGMMGDGAGSLSGAELDKISDKEFEKVCETTNVYARVSPDHKVRIVTALKNNDHIASMTGDGVNDAMALKSADIGVAMGITGTDVAKNSSDMILTDDNFATIVSAVEEGRVIYSNIRKFVGFLLSCNVGEILVIFLISLIPSSLIPGIATPLTAIQLLWLNLVTDSFPALALGREKGEPDIMKQPPRKKSESIINKPMKISILVQSLAIFAAVCSSFILGLTVFFKDAAAPIEGARTMAFATLILAELFRAYGARSERISVFKLGVFSNKFMNISVAGSIALLLAVIYIPGVNGIFDNIMLAPVYWIPIVLLAFIPFAASEVFKLIKNRK
ncbi:MAG: cation-translocating P-type ATPase [Clostridiales bacterium]|nr:cation-translocating P-type ATPase [Clostridiales bacterium]